MYQATIFMWDAFGASALQLPKMGTYPPVDCGGNERTECTVEHLMHLLCRSVCARCIWPWLLQDILVHQERWLFPLKDIKRTVSKGNWHGSLLPWWFPLRFFYSHSIGVGIGSHHSIYTLSKVSSPETREEKWLAPEYNLSRVYIGVSPFINNHLEGIGALVPGGLTSAVTRVRGWWSSVYHNPYLTLYYIHIQDWEEPSYSPHWELRVQETSSTTGEKMVSLY